MQGVARKFFIRGEVQGVGYRFFAQRAAARHQIVGYVRNCSDGSVEAFAEGPASSVEAFKHDLATGPQWAIVIKWKRFVWSRRVRILRFESRDNCNDGPSKILDTRSAGLPQARHQFL